MKELVGAFNQEGLLRDCTTGCGTDGSFYSTNHRPAASCSDQPASQAVSAPPRPLPRPLQVHGDCLASWCAPCPLQPHKTQTKQHKLPKTLSAEENKQKYLFNVYPLDNMWLIPTERWIIILTKFSGSRIARDPSAAVLPSWLCTGDPHSEGK